MALLFLLAVSAQAGAIQNGLDDFTISGSTIGSTTTVIDVPFAYLGGAPQFGGFGVFLNISVAITGPTCAYTPTTGCESDASVGVSIVGYSNTLWYDAETDQNGASAFGGTEENVALPGPGTYTAELIITEFLYGTAVTQANLMAPTTASVNIRAVPGTSLTADSAPQFSAASAIPEPGTLVLALAGLCVTVMVRRKPARS